MAAAGVIATVPTSPVLAGAPSRDEAWALPGRVSPPRSSRPSSCGVSVFPFIVSQLTQTGNGGGDNWGRGGRTRWPGLPGNVPAAGGCRRGEGYQCLPLGAAEPRPVWALTYWSSKASFSACAWALRSVTDMM